MSLFNIYDQASFTRRVQVALRTRMEELNPLPRQLVTVVPTTEDKIKMERSEIKAFGYAKPKAFGATPPIYVPRVRYTETEVELLPIHEMSPIDERLLRKLESNDADVVQRAGADAVLRATALQARNELGWDKLTMDAIMTGYLTVLFADEPTQGLTIDYNAPPANFTNVPVPWTTLATAKPVDDIRAVQLYLANLVGQYGIHIWMNSNTMNTLLLTTQASALLTGFDGRAQMIPKINDLAARLFEPDRVQWHVSDSGYRGETYDRGIGSHTKFIPDNKVIITTEDPFEGETLVEVFEGRTAVPVSEFQKPVLRSGPQSWVKLDTNSLTTYYHFASTKIPRINRPDCIAVMDVS